MNRNSELHKPSNITCEDSTSMNRLSGKRYPGKVLSVIGQLNFND
jgi:hypothetical protein